MMMIKSFSLVQPRDDRGLGHVDNRSVCSLQCDWCWDGAQSAEGPGQRTTAATTTPSTRSTRYRITAFECARQPEQLTGEPVPAFCDHFRAFWLSWNQVVKLTSASLAPLVLA